VRVYYEDTDAGGVVYHANYLKFMERARSEWLRAIGYEQDALIREQGLVFAVRSITLSYRKPARFNDLLHVTVSIARLGKASLVFSQAIAHAKSDGEKELLTTGSVKLASLDADTFKPKPISRQFIQDLKSAS
jgi:acyl-CoA thioester hydrolase